MKLTGKEQLHLVKLGVLIPVLGILLGVIFGLIVYYGLSFVPTFSIFQRKLILWGLIVMCFVIGIISAVNSIVIFIKCVKEAEIAGNGLQKMR
jgi:hypothetical protein